MKIGYIFADRKNAVLRSGGKSVHIQETCSALGELGHDVFIVAAIKGDETAVIPYPPRVYECRMPQPLVNGVNQFVSRRRGSGDETPVSKPGQVQTMTWKPKVVAGDIARRLVARAWDNLFLRQARRIIELERPEVLYERYVADSLAGTRLAREFGLPLILEMNASYTFTYEWWHRHSPLYPMIQKRAERQIGMSADKILVVSSGLEQYMRGLGVPAERIEVMRNAADPERFKENGVPMLNVREKYGLGQAPLVGFIGSFRPWHDIDIILDSVKLVVEQCPGVRFLIAGDGPLRPRLESRVRDEDLDAYVTFTGYIPRDEAAGYIRAMDVALAPYPQLPYIHFSPIKIFEYMAAARPMIVTRYPDTESVITHRHSGLLVDPGDRSSFAQAILELVKDPALRERLGRGARQTILEKYTWRGNAERIVELYKDIQETRSRRPV